MNLTKQNGFYFTACEAANNPGQSVAIFLKFKTMANFMEHLQQAGMDKKRVHFFLDVHSDAYREKAKDNLLSLAIGGDEMKNIMGTAMANFMEEVKKKKEEHVFASSVVSDQDGDDDDDEEEEKPAAKKPFFSQKFQDEVAKATSLLTQW